MGRELIISPFPRIYEIKFWKKFYFFTEFAGIGFFDDKFSNRIQLTYLGSKCLNVTHEI